MRVRNKFSKRVIEAREAPINHDWVVMDGTQELHRGNQLTAQRYVQNLLGSQPYLYERI